MYRIFLRLLARQYFQAALCPRLTFSCVLWNSWHCIFSHFCIVTLCSMTYWHTINLMISLILYHIINLFQIPTPHPHPIKQPLFLTNILLVVMVTDPSSPWCFRCVSDLGRSSRQEVCIGVKACGGRCSVHRREDTGGNCVFSARHIWNRKPNSSVTLLVPMSLFVDWFCHFVPLCHFSFN